MRLVLDTNTALSGLLWGGTPAQLIRFAQAGIVELVASPELIAELRKILPRQKFEKALGRRGLSKDFVLNSYFLMCELVEAAPIPPTVLRDPDDDSVLAAALAGKVELIVSGDADLLDIGAFRSIRIVNAARAVEIIEGQDST